MTDSPLNWTFEFSQLPTIVELLATNFNYRTLIILLIQPHRILQLDASLSQSSLIWSGAELD